MAEGVIKKEMILLVKAESTDLTVHWIRLVEEGEESERMPGFGAPGIGTIVLPWRDKKVWRLGGS